MKEIDLLEKVEEVVKETSERAEKKNREVFKKYPIIFSALSLMGFLSVLYGFERILDQFSFSTENPWAVLVFGLIVLLITGTLYKWLQNKEVDFY